MEIDIWEQNCPLSLDRAVRRRSYCMKKKEWRASLQILMTLCALWGWWGMLYPEFTLTADTYCVVYEEDAETAGNEQGVSARELYQKLLQASKGQVRFRSKLLMQLQKWMEQ